MSSGHKINAAQPIINPFQPHFGHFGHFGQASVSHFLLSCCSTWVEDGTSILVSLTRIVASQGAEGRLDYGVPMQILKSRVSIIDIN
jgi:hypothetical protein